MEHEGHLFCKEQRQGVQLFRMWGGSSMGYKLAGYDVIGCNEIDPRMNKCYVENHHPKFNYLCDIKEMVTATDLPAELYNLDVLDGSPPCSTFSISGNREKDWGVEKHFREGQKSQVLDTLFFDFIALAKKLQPKVVISENVKGMLVGKAIEYVNDIHKQFDAAGYYCQHFLLDASKMGVPQKRERVFFLCLRKDLAEPFLSNTDMFTQHPLIDMSFDEEPILYGEVADYQGKEINPKSKTRMLWEHIIDSDTSLCDAHYRLMGKRGFFNFVLFDENRVPPTLVPAEHLSLICKNQPKYLGTTEILKCSSFPLDYKGTDSEIGYLCGMSVPPVMMAQVASRVYDYWLKFINTETD